jgi:hypothetical protein
MMGGVPSAAKYGRLAELAPPYVFLASAESGYVIGETLNLNGGSPNPKAPLYSVRASPEIRHRAGPLTCPALRNFLHVLCKRQHRLRRRT